jgi:hypothetical protein
MVPNISLVDSMSPAAVAPGLPPVPSKASVLRFEENLKIGHDHMKASQATTDLKTLQAIDQRSSFGRNVTNVATQFNDDYRKAYSEDLQKLIDLDPADPYYMIRNIEFSIAFSRVNMQFTIVSGIADSGKQSMNTLLKNQA